MRRSIEATVEPDGSVSLHQSLRVVRPCRAIVTLIDEDIPETALLSEAVLAEDWERPEEDEAWSHLQSWTAASAETAKEAGKT